MNQRQYMLDTDTSSYIINGRVPSVRRRLAEKPPTQICISVVTRAELLYGLQGLPSDHHYHEGIWLFLGETITLPWGDDAPTSMPRFVTSSRRQVVRSGIAT